MTKRPERVDPPAEPADPAAPASIEAEQVIDPTDRPVPGHVLMPLLTRLTQESMDAGYRMVAERRAVEESTSAGPDRDRRGWVTAVVAGVFGVLLTVAAVQTSRNADVEALGRASLAERITQEKTAIRDLQDRAGALLDENAASESSLRDLREREQQLTARVSRVGTRTGYLAVRGPGLRVTVDDPPGEGETIAVKDEDLHLLVDGLWAAGAEAIAINGQRLTVVSPIQNTGGAIHVNVRPLNPPYVVEAIGDPDQMSGRLLASTNGSLFYAVARSLGFVLDVEDDGNLQLPAARVRTLRSAVSGTSGEQTDDSKEATTP